MSYIGRSLLLLLSASLAVSQPVMRFGILGGGNSSYCRVLAAVELPCQPASNADVALIVPASSARTFDQAAIERIGNAVRGGTLLVTEEDTPLSRSLGLSFAAQKVEVTQVEDVLYPRVPIIWERAVQVVAPLPLNAAKVLVKEKWSGAPLMLTYPLGKGRVLFLAAELEGYARFPYFIQALIKDCGVSLPFRSPRLQAFFDYGYRTTVDLDYFAQRWRKNGLRALHVSAWHFYDRTRDDYLKQLIAACHRQGILTYAWFELPHVSDAFWHAHPEWREKTAAQADAKLDWRELINLLDPAAFETVSNGMLSLLADFDWDGVNIAELYFESPQGPENEQRFTPMNAMVRAEFQAESGFDPLELFRRDSPRFWKKDAAAWKRFVEYRAGLVTRLNEKILGVTERARRTKPYLDIAVTFVDNLYDERMKEAIGSDVNRILPLAGRFPFTLMIEDPSTIWSLGPSRYRVLGERYRTIAPGARMGIDINVVDRYQDVFPTKKQTGSEFLEGFHTAGEFFENVLVYFEQSVYPQDMELVSHALASGARVTDTGVESPRPVLFRAGNAGRILVDGSEWPARDGEEVSLPAGKHSVEVKDGIPPPLSLQRLTGELLAASYEGQAMRFRYRSQARAIAVFSARPASIKVDGTVFQFQGEFVLLPPGEHEVLVEK